MDMRLEKTLFPLEKSQRNTDTPIQVQVLIANWSASVTGGRPNPALATNKYHVKIHYLTQTLKLADRLIQIASEITSSSSLVNLDEVRAQ